VGRGLEEMRCAGAREFASRLAREAVCQCGQGVYKCDIRARARRKNVIIRDAKLVMRRGVYIVNACERREPPLSASRMVLM
jgi:hypothetical protein